MPANFNASADILQASRIILSSRPVLRTIIAYISKRAPSTKAVVSSTFF